MSPANEPPISPARRARVRRWRWVGLAYLAFIFLVILGADLGRLPIGLLGKLPHYDLYGHFGLYGLGAALAHFSWNRRRWKLLAFGPAAVALFALAEELAQAFFPTRTASVSDLLAGLGGIVVGGVLAELWARRTWRD